MLHPSLSYFADRYGLHQIPLGRKSAEETPADYARRVEEAKTASLFIAETTQDPSRVKETAATLRLPVLTVSLNSETWDQALMKIAKALSSLSQ